MRRRGRRLVHYGAAAVGVAVAALLRWVLVETFGTGVPPFVTFFGAVAIAAALGGLGPGVLALLLSVATITLAFFEPPVLPGDVAGLAVFTATGVLLAVLGGRLREARRRERERAAALVELSDSLERRVVERTSEIRALAGELLRAEQRERARLATVLHDGLQQLLVAAKVQLGIVRRRASPESLTTAEQLIDQSIEASRTLTVELSPPILRQRGLAAGLEWLGRWMEDKHGLTVRVNVEGGGLDADQDVRTFLFEAAREALLNVVKHAGTDAAVVSLDRTGDRLRTRVEDRGKGFDPAQRAAEERHLGGTGLLGIRQRAELLGGRLEVTSTPGQGTCVALEIPIRGDGPPPPGAGG